LCRSSLSDQQLFETPQFQALRHLETLTYTFPNILDCDCCSALPNHLQHKAALKKHEEKPFGLTQFTGIQRSECSHM
jgi:hypothetical protein